MRLPARSAGARQGAAAQPPLPRTKALTRLGQRLRTNDGFTIVEVMVAAMVLVVGLGALMGMLITSSHVIKSARIRQEDTSIAREVLENSRNLPYTSLNTPALAAALVSQIPQSTLNGTNLVVQRALSPSSSGNYSFNATITACSVDSPADGYGNHGLAPSSGGSWCYPVAPDGTADSQPDDYKRVSVTVTPVGLTTPSVSQSILIYPRPVNGPAVTCLSITTTCPGTNPPQVQTGSSMTFNVTTTSTADRIQWLVNGNPAPASQIGGSGVDPYAPSGTTSSFTWTYPTTTIGTTKYTIDGTYTITAVAYDADGNAGTRSTLQVQVNEHPVLAPTSVTAGWNDLMQGVDVTWLPSVDQDVLYYQVWHVWNVGSNQVRTQVTSCGNAGNVSGTSCADTMGILNAEAPPLPAARPSCASPPQSYTTTNYYYVVGFDTDPTTGTPRQSTFNSIQPDANICNHPPNAPSLATPTSANGQLTLNWTAASPADPDTATNNDSITGWRIYRWPSTGTMTDPGSRYQLVGASPTSYTDTSPDPGGIAQNYCVTAVDSHLDESSCSNVQPG